MDSQYDISPHDFSLDSEILCSISSIRPRTLDYSRSSIALRFLVRISNHNCSYPIGRAPRMDDINVSEKDLFCPYPDVSMSYVSIPHWSLKYLHSGYRFVFQAATSIVSALSTQVFMLPLITYGRAMAK